MTTQTTDSVFAGLKVVEIASFIAAPAAATMLSDFGADVIKVEPPGLGVRMLLEDAPLQGVTLLARHRAHVERVSWLLVHGLLQLAAVDELNVGNRRPRRPSGVLVLLQAGAERGEDIRPIIVQRGGALPDARAPRAFAGYGGREAWAL